MIQVDIKKTHNSEERVGVFF